MMYQLAVRSKIDHYNNAEWFVVVELESGEELTDVDLSADAERFMFELISAQPDKYFTQQRAISADHAG